MMRQKDDEGLHFIIFIYWKLLLSFGITTVQKSRAMEICRMPRCQNIILSKIFRAKRLWWCNDRLCLYKNIRLKFKYQLLILCFIIQRSSKLCSWRLAVRLWQENCQHLAVWNTLYFLIFTTIFFTESRLLSVFGFLLKGVRLQQFFFLLVYLMSQFSEQYVHLL